MATNELKVLNSVCKNKDISVLMAQNVDELFVGFPDVWQFIKEYYSKHRSIPDAKLVEDKFGYFDEIEITGETAYHLDSLREEYLNGKLEEVALKFRANIGNIAATRILQGSINDLMKLQNVSSSTKDLDITDTDSAEKHYEAVREKAAMMGGVPGIPTGVGFIDSAYTSGLAGGDLIIVLGWTGRAKSLLTTYIACHAHSIGFKPMIVSQEMSTEKVRDRAYTMMGKGLFKNSDLAVGDIDEDNFRTWSKKLNATTGFVIIEHDGNGEVTPAVVQSKIDQHKPSIIILDYAQLMSDNANSTDMVSRMRNMSREYKRLAMSNDIPVILISSATPDSASATNTPPIIEQVAWSKQLAFDADLAFSVHRHDGMIEDTKVVVEVAGRKNRNGDLFSGYFLADINNGIWKEFYSLEEIGEL